MRPKIVLPAAALLAMAPACAGAATQINTNLLVTVNLGAANSCNFGQVASVTFVPPTQWAGALNYSGSIQVTCTFFAQSFSVGLDKGSWGTSTNDRKMALVGNSSQKLSYQLYRTGFGIDPWGDITDSTGNQPATGFGVGWIFTVFGVLPKPSPVPTSGIYQDQVRITLQF